MGILYCLMSMGINFIYGIMKVINWSMGEFFMIGAYVQYLLLTYIIGSQFWFAGIFIAAFIVFVLGAVVQRMLIKPMFVGIIEAKMPVDAPPLIEEEIKAVEEWIFSLKLKAEDKDVSTVPEKKKLKTGAVKKK